jgi:ABC-type amino acid transport substrate-binding protein
VYIQRLGLCLLGIFLASGVFAQNPRLNLAEKTWLDEHQTLKVGVVAINSPILSVKGGQPIGLAADYLRAMTSKLGLYLDLATFSDWQSLAYALRTGEVDIVGALVPTSTIPLEWHLSRPYLTLPAALYSRDKITAQDLGSLAEMEVSVLSGSVWEEFLPNYIMGARIKSGENLDQALNLVMSGKAQVYLGDAMSVDYLIESGRYEGLQKQSLSNLTLDISFATYAKNPTLHSLMQKTMDRLSEDEHNDVWGNWPKLERPTASETSFFTYIFWALLLIVWSLVLVWMVLRRSKMGLEQHREKTRRSIKRLRRREQLLKQKLMHIKHRARRYRHRSRDLSNHIDFMNTMLPCATWRWGPASELCVWDDEMFALTGFDQEHFKPSLKNILGVVSERDRAPLESLFDSENHTVSRISFRIQPPEGDEKLLLQFSHYIPSDGKEEGERVAVCWDVTHYHELSESPSFDRANDPEFIREHVKSKTEQESAQDDSSSVAEEKTDGNGIDSETSSEFSEANSTDFSEFIKDNSEMPPEMSVPGSKASSDAHKRTDLSSGSSVTE